MNEKYHDHEYLDLIRRVLDGGAQKGDRTGTGTISKFAEQLRFDLTGGSIPLLTTKKMHTKSIIHELIWFLAGDTNIKYLNDNGVRIWNEWADENGDLGPVYGKQWRRWEQNRIVGVSDEGYSAGARLHGAIVERNKIDQIAQVIKQLRNNPNDRRIIVSAWNVGEIDQMALPPCHAFFQFWSREVEGEDKRRLSCHLYQRSCDIGLGVPFNIAQYSFLVHMIAQVTNHTAEEFVWTGGDTHIYNNHIDQLTGQLELEPYPSPTLKLNPDVKEIEDFVFEDFEVEGYESHPTIKMSVSV